MASKGLHDEREGIPEKQPLPCGSGKEYKVCCAQKGIKYVTKRGEVSRDLIPEDGARAFQGAVDEFKEMFGDRDTYDHNRLPLRGGTRRRGPSK